MMSSLYIEGLIAWCLATHSNDGQYIGSRFDAFTEQLRQVLSEQGAPTYAAVISFVASDCGLPKLPTALIQPALDRRSDLAVEFRQAIYRVFMRCCFDRLSSPETIGVMATDGRPIYRVRILPKREIRWDSLTLFLSAIAIPFDENWVPECSLLEGRGIIVPTLPSHYKAQYPNMGATGLRRLTSENLKDLGFLMPLSGFSAIGETIVFCTRDFKIP